MKRWYFILCVLANVLLPLHLSLAAAPPASPDDVKAIVDKMIDAGGGERVIESMTGLSATGKITAFMRQDQGSYAVLFRRPRKLRVETKYARSAETRILNGTTGYRGTDATPLTQVSDARYLAMVYQYKHLDLLYGLLHRRYSVISTGSADADGRSVMMLHLSDQEGPAMDVAVDTTTFLVVRVSGTFTVAGGRATTLASEFYDFRTVAGAKLPFRIVNYAGGQRIAETVVERYTVNPLLPDALFAP